MAARPIPTISTPIVPAKFCQMIRRVQRAIAKVSVNFARSLPTRQHLRSRAQRQYRTHRNADNGFGESGRIIDPITDHRDDGAMADEIFDACPFVLRK